MNELGDVKVLFIAGFGPIVREETASRRLYCEALGIRFKEETGGYLHTEGLEGAKTFALWRCRKQRSLASGRIRGPTIFPRPKGGWSSRLTAWRERRRRSRRAAIGCS